ncbi:unnamed protein product [Arctogadus glacialis]
MCERGGECGAPRDGGDAPWTAVRRVVSSWFLKVDLHVLRHVALFRLNHRPRHHGTPCRHVADSPSVPPAVLPFYNSTDQRDNGRPSSLPQVVPAPPLQRVSSGSSSPSPVGFQ